MQMNDRELAVTLAALRNFQCNFYRGRSVKEARKYVCTAFPDHFELVEPPTDGQIDRLCERLNCASELLEGCGDEEHCPKNEQKKHEIDPYSMMHNGDSEPIVDFHCKHCGRSGSAMVPGGDANW